MLPSCWSMRRASAVWRAGLTEFTTKERVRAMRKMRQGRFPDVHSSTPSQEGKQCNVLFFEQEQTPEGERCQVQTLGKNGARVWQRPFIKREGRNNEKGEARKVGRSSVQKIFQGYEAVVKQRQTMDRKEEWI
ncbi:hypothetical protein NDU88_004644 [Pleurodeles waltl]|uniref:Uncharacterized protein n=1 Tax=Pleurodeles waltl TaxID=8319 RepID=A0AAV7RM58_PLEWA|nr:hypothetical protein NDU88_004644 [Pleurodeles waltl]